MGKDDLGLVVAFVGLVLLMVVLFHGYYGHYPWEPPIPTPTPPPTPPPVTPTPTPITPTPTPITPTPTPPPGQIRYVGTEFSAEHGYPIP